MQLKRKKDLPLESLRIITKKNFTPSDPLALCSTEKIRGQTSNIIAMKEEDSHCHVSLWLRAHYHQGLRNPDKPFKHSLSLDVTS